MPFYCSKCGEELFGSNRIFCIRCGDKRRLSPNTGATRSVRDTPTSSDPGPTVTLEDSTDDAEYRALRESSFNRACFGAFAFITVFKFLEFMSRMATVARGDIGLGEAGALPRFDARIAVAVSSGMFSYWSFKYGWPTPNEEKASTGSLLTDVWLGFRPLPQVFWFWGVFLHTLLDGSLFIVGYYLYSITGTSFPMTVCLAVQLPYTIWVSVGMWRSATPVYGQWSIGTRICSVLVVALVVGRAFAFRPGAIEESLGKLF